MKNPVKIISLLVLILVFTLSIVPFLSACDTWVALANATLRGFIILAKNSDRLLYGCQPLIFYAHKKWPSGSTINLGRITIPQVEETYATLGSSPYWCWGYEEGINEYGVAIGNEGIFTKPLVEAMSASKEGKGPKLGPTGMDLLRLGLERGKTAREALEVIISLVEKYGQFGSGLPAVGVEGAYNNSYIIADPNEAWVLETACTRWIAKKFTKGTTSISNKLSITTEWELASPDIVEFAVEKGWWPESKIDDFNFEKAYMDVTPKGRARNMRSHIRATCSQRLLKEKKGEITFRWMMRIARDRSTFPSIDLDQTASSCVAILPNTHDELPVFWWCAVTPSSSCYIPFFVQGSKLPEIVSTAGMYGKRIVPPSKAERDAFASSSYWWLFRDLCDKTNINWDKRNPIVRAEFDRLEQEFAAKVPDVTRKALALRKKDKEDEAARILDKFSEGCVEKAVTKVNELRKRFEADEDVPENYRLYIGKYIANFGPYRNDEFKVVIKNNRLAVDIPSQKVVELKEPDEEGMWYFTITTSIAVTFDQEENGTINALKFHQQSVLQKEASPDESIPEDVPEEYKPYLGKYKVPMRNVKYTVVVKNGRLAVDIPGQLVVELLPPDEKDRWYFSIDETTSVSFERDESGKVTAMKIHQTFVLPKKQTEFLNH